MPPKKINKEPKEKGNDLFEFLAGITTDQSIGYFDNLTEAEKKKYKTSRYMIHRFLSMNSNYLPVVDELQTHTGIPDRCHYLFLTNILPRGRQFNKYIKGVHNSLYEEWLINLVSKHYHVSHAEAVVYLKIYYSQDKDSLRNLCKSYGIEQKLLKSAKL